MLKSTNWTRTESSTEPIDPSEVADYLRIDYNDHTAMLTNLAKDARQTLETGYLWKCCISSTCIDYFENFDELELHWQPVQSITSITYVDQDGVTQTLSTDVYELGKRNGIGYVRLKYNQNWPTSLRGHDDVITVTYVAGYGAASTNVPEAIRQAIIQYAGHRYDNPEDQPPSWVLSAVSPYMDTRVTA